ncbi:MAG: hypothetical protein NTZ09_02260 [Candidatus Hydrogenedentes bacterium]|nr:hypothetical protein [Candidatus Hydrogenedentota bacterium]
MRHVLKVSATLMRPEDRRRIFVAVPDRADAKTDFMNAVYNAWTDFVYQKKNELSV